MSDSTLAEMVREMSLEICNKITVHPGFREVRGRVVAFMQDKNANEIFKELTEKRHELQKKHAAGVEIPASEVRQFEVLRDEFAANPCATRFMEAQHMVNEVQDALLRAVNKTFELGRAPTREELTSCCNDSGCGCRHS